MIEQFADEAGVVLRRDVVRTLSDDRVLTRAVRNGSLVRIRQGAYVLGTVWQQADREARHLLLVRAVLKQYGDDVAASHASAHLVLGGPSWGLDLTNAHLTHLTPIGGRRRSARIIHHHGACLVDDVTRTDEGWMTAAARTALDTASLAPRVPAVAVLDWHLNQGLTTLEELTRVFERMEQWPRTLSLQMVLRLADGRSESVAETRARLLFLESGLPAPTPQYEIHHPSGRLAGRVDFAWPEYKVMVEIDGLEKYLRLRRAGESVADAVVREKKREDLLRELTGWTMLRFVWSDLDRPRATADRVRRALSRAA